MTTVVEGAKASSLRRIPPAGAYDFQWGFATYPNQAMAKRRAEDDARHRLVRKLEKAHDRSKVNVMQHIDTSYYEPRYDTATGVACVLAIFPKTALSTVDKTIAQRSKQLDVVLDEMAKEAREAVGSEAVRLGDPRWGRTGRGPGPIGNALNNRAARALTRAGVKQNVKLNDRVLRFQLDREGDQCSATPYLQTKDGGFSALKAVAFHPIAVGETTCRPVGNDFLDDAAIGLVEGHRPGIGGLTVELEVDTYGGMLCAGQPYELAVVTNEPAYVHLYSVTEEGKVLLSYVPEDPIGGRWPVSPKPMAIDLERGAEYRLVAVAVPVREGKKALDDRAPEPGRAPCRV